MNTNLTNQPNYFYQAKTISHSLPIHPSLSPFPPALLTLASSGHHPAKAIVDRGLKTHVLIQHEIKAPHQQESESNHHIQLDVDAASQRITEGKRATNQHVNEDLGESGERVRVAIVINHMMQVRAVRTERRFAVDDTHRHHTNRIEHRHRKDGQGQCHHIHTLILIAHPVSRRVITEHLHHTPCHQHAHRHRSGITDKHLRRLAQDVMQQEREQPHRHRQTEHRRRIVLTPVESIGEEQRAGDTQAARQSIHAIDHIDRIDDTHTRKDRQRHGNPP